MMFYYYNTSLLSFSILRYLICLRQSRAMAKNHYISLPSSYFSSYLTPSEATKFLFHAYKNPENEHTEYQITSKTTF